MCARDLDLVDAGVRAIEVASVLTQWSMVLLPLAAAVAITRHRLFGIDVLIGRTLVYVPLVGMLGGLYALAVAAFQRVFLSLTGETSDAALLAALFLIAAAVTPLRKALEAAVDSWAGPRGLPLDGRPADRRVVSPSDGGPQAASDPHESPLDPELARVAARVKAELLARRPVTPVGRR